MKKKTFLLVIIIFATQFSLAQKKMGHALDQYSRVKFKIETIGNKIVGVNQNYSLINVAGIMKELRHNSENRNPVIDITYTEINPGMPTIYDLVSDGTPNNVQMNSNTSLLHMTLVHAPFGDPPPNFPNKKVKYYKSTNFGASWSFVIDVPDGSKGGEPSLSLLSNGAALVSSACIYPPETIERARWFCDAFAGLGSFTELEFPDAKGYSYPRVISTSNITNPIKFVSLISSYNLDSAFLVKCTSMSPAPGTFPPVSFINAKTAGCYYLTKGDDGRIGIAYIANNILQPAETGDVYFMESTDNGTTFNSPVKIFDANISSTGDSLGGFRGISAVYRGNVPCVTFETVKQTTDGHYFPGAPAKIRFWSSSLPGSDPNRSVVVADTSKYGFHPYISKGTNNDPFASFCRPSIGTSKGNRYLYITFMVPSDTVGGSHDTSSYMNLYLAYSTTGGTNWITGDNYTKYKLNPNSPVYDWTYPSVLQKNDSITSGYPLYMCVNLCSLRDSVPGSYINHPLNGSALGNYVFVRVKIPYYYEPPEPPPTPSLISPSNEATNVLLNPVLDWSNTSYTESYNAQISLLQNFNSLIIDTSLVPSQFTVPLGKLNINTTYYWRARSHNNIGGYSNWSTVWSFTTRSTGINTLGTEIPTEYKLHNNFPNPFNPTTKIHFDLPKASDTKLIIYDILGKEIAVLVNEKLSPGKFEIEWKASAYSSGIYFYKIETDNFVDVKKLVLIK